MTIWKTFLAGGAALSFGFGAAVSGEVPNQPNFIVVLIDDMGWMDCDLYGSTYYETPHLRRLAKEGMMFTDAYAASPLCSPTRASIMVGQHPARLHMTLAITTNSAFEPTSLPPENGRYTGTVESRDHLPADLTTLADLLRENGYQTAHIGKWHLSRPHTFGGENRRIYNAENRGFDFVIAGDHQPGPPDYYSPYSRAPQNRENWVSEIRNLEAGPEGEYLNERLTEEAVKWLETTGESGRPFFLNLWHYAVHTPVIPKRDLMPKYQAKADPHGLQDCPEMATMLENMDESLGILLDYLDRPENHRMRDNTLLVVLSDNGGVTHLRVNDRQITSNRPLRGGKANTYEGGIRVPWIVRFPGVVEAGTVSGEPIVSTDLFPTLLDYAGVAAPSEHPVDGASLRPVFEGETMGERPLFFDFPHVFGILCAPSTAVRLGDYKLLRFYWAGDEPGTHYHELYDLRRDPSEAINLAAYKPEKVRRLSQLLDKHLERTNALIPIRNEEFVGNPRTPRSHEGQRGSRPASLRLSETEWALTEQRGSRTVQLLDQTGEPRTTSALLLAAEDASWLEIDHLPDGAVEIRWDQTRRENDAAAKVLFGWSGGRSPWEINDWSFDPIELIIE